MTIGAKMQKPLHITLLALALVLTLVGCEDESVRPKGSSKAAVYNGYYGAVYKRYAVTTEDRERSHWVQELVEGYARPKVGNAPARFEAASLSSCELPRPSEDAKVILVELYGGNNELPLYFVSGKEVAGVASYIEQTGERPSLDSMMKSNAADQIDILITETAQPVYLVLTAYDEIVWSLHLAEGAKLDGVSVIGDEAQALAHVPEGTPTAIVVLDQSPQRSCVVSPQNPVTDSWKALKALNRKHGGDGFRRTIDKAERAHQAFRNWLQPRVGSVDLSLSAYQTSHVLIGPMPSAPIPYRPLTDAVIAYSPSASPIWADEDTAVDTVYEWAESGG